MSVLSGLSKDDLEALCALCCPHCADADPVAYIDVYDIYQHQQHGNICHASELRAAWAEAGGECSSSRVRRTAAIFLLIVFVLTMVGVMFAVVR